MRDLFADVLSDFKSGRLQPYPQDVRPATYNCTRLLEDGLIDWPSSRDNIINLINALAPPYPSAPTFLNGKKFSIKKSTTSDARIFEGIVCGRVTFLNSGGSAEVLASDGAILILEAEYDGEVGPPGKWIKSVKTTLGINLENLLTRMSALEEKLSTLSKKVED